MNVKSAWLVAVVMTVAGVSTTRAQYAEPRTMPVGPATPPSLLPGPGGPPPGAPVPSAGTVDGAVPTPLPHRLSDWIIGARSADCCGPAGGDGPLCMELYTRTGVSFIIDSSFLGRTLKPGWLIQGGGRTLFFNPEGDAAWTIDLGLSHSVNAGKHDDRKAVLLDIIVPESTADPFTGQVRNVRVPRVLVTTRRLHRTFVNFGFGREWYLSGMAPGCCGGVNNCADASCGNTWRAGFDIGGRWGSANLELNEIRHRTDVIGGLWVALHSDLEVPCGCCIFTVGGRIEWDYTWSDVLQRQNNADVQSIQMLATFGVRF